MYKALSIIALLVLVTPGFAADKFEGTWKLNTQKSTGPEIDKECQLVAVDHDNEQLITVTGKAPDGSSFTNKFSVLLKGGIGKIIEANPFDGVTAKAFTANTEDFMFTSGNKPAMHIHSVLARDGKTMKTTRRVMSGPSKPGSYSDIWEKQ